MMEQANARKSHGDVVLVAGGDDMVVAHGTASLSHVGHTAAVGTLDVVAEGEEGVRAQRDAPVEGDPFLFLSTSEHFGFFGEVLLPLAVGQDVHVVVRDVQVDGVVAVGAADLLHPGEVHHLRVLAQPPDVGLVTGQAGAVDAALLPGANADGLTVLDVADGVALGVLERDEGDAQVTLGLLGKRLVASGDILEEVVARKVDLVAPLLEGDAVDLLVLDGGGAIVGVDADDVVRALALLAQDGQRLVREARRDDAVAHFALDEQGRRLVARVAQGDEVAVRRHAVRPARAGAGRSDGRQGLRDVVDEINFAQRVAQRQAHGGTGGRDVLERRGRGEARGCLQLADQLPAVQGVEEVNVAGPAVQYFDGELPLVHVDARRLLIGIAAVLQC